MARHGTTWHGTARHGWHSMACYEGTPDSGSGACTACCIAASEALVGVVAAKKATDPAGPDCSNTNRVGCGCGHQICQT